MSRSHPLSSLMLIDAVRTHLRVGPDLDPPRAEVALEPERPDRSRVIVADFLLLGIVAHALADVGFAVIAARGKVARSV